MRRGEWVLAESHLEAALKILDGQDQSSQQASIYADWSLTAHRQSHVQQANELAQCALRLAEASDDTPALAQAHNILGMLASHQHDAQRIITNFSATLRGEVELTELSEQLVAVVEETMQPAQVSLWLNPPRKAAYDAEKLSDSPAS
jgi:lipopolysaccharide biosynthesis regulator YciM